MTLCWFPQKGKFAHFWSLIGDFGELGNSVGANVNNWEQHRERQPATARARLKRFESFEIPWFWWRKHFDKENSSIFFSLPFFGVVGWSFFLFYTKSCWKHCKQIPTLREFYFCPRSDLKIDPSEFNGYSSTFYSIEPISNIRIVIGKEILFKGQIIFNIGISCFSFLSNIVKLINLDKTDFLNIFSNSNY